MVMLTVMASRLLAATFLLAACSRTPEPGGSARSPEESEAGGLSGQAPDTTPSCVVPLLEPEPPAATTLEECPADPGGRPVMPRSTVRFPEAPGKPTLDVELALTDAHRAHGLMYRPHLAELEGMLFTFDDESVHAFWMQNTCLALDMMFIDSSGVIVGVVEQIPPWNTKQRRVSCPSTHVLEVRAGWTRDHGVVPGQHVILGN
jgi:uncharacterized protein